MDEFGLGLRPLAGGYSGETFVTDDGAAVVRIYARNPGRLVVDAALLRLVRGIVPVPEVLETRLPSDGRPGLLVTKRLPGTRLDLILAEADEPLVAAIGAQLGELLARLSGMPMPGFGALTGADLRVDPAAMPAVDLVDWARLHRETGRLAGWADADWAGLLELVDQAELLADNQAVDRRVLVHSDFNPKNVLADPDSGAITGLLDWEFAHAGSPYTDLGNVTRFERHPVLVKHLLRTFESMAPPLGGHVLRRARAADLWALIDLAGSAERNPVRDLAAELLLAQVRRGDLLAWPWEQSRRDP